MHRFGLLVCAALGCSSPSPTPADPPAPTPVAAPADPRASTPVAPPVVTPTPPADPPASSPVATPTPVGKPSADPLAGTGPTPGRVVLTSEAKDSPPGLDRNIIRRLIRDKMDAVTACYDAGLQRNPELRGRVNVEFAIAPTGKTTVRKTSSDLKGGAAVEACIGKVVASLTFPRTEQETVVTYPFVLQPG